MTGNRKVLLAPASANLKWNTSLGKLIDSLASSTVVVLLAAMLVGCGITGNPVRDDPLIGRIYDTVEGKEISQELLLIRVSNADVVYLGEKHDNAQHHARQVEILQALLDRGLKPVIGFEFFDVGETGYLNQYVQANESELKLAKKGRKADAAEVLRKRLGWQDADDEYWEYYFRIIELAKRHRLQVFGADLPDGVKTRISRVALHGLTAVERGLLTPTGHDNDAYRQLMYEEFRRGHCGWGEERLLQRLYQTWVARNDRMATSVIQMADLSTEGPIVMILGNGHVQHDQGVYERVAFLRPGLKQLNLGFREISREPSLLDEYLQAPQVAGQQFMPSHQLLWFSQRQDYQDPCEAFR